MGREERGRWPLYIQLREELRARIDSGEYPPGSCIPSENQLSERYGLSRLAVRSALAALEQEGRLRSVRGKGVYVSGPRLQRDLETLGGFRQTIRSRDQEPSTRVLVKAQRPAGPLYARLLGVEQTSWLWYVKRICLSNGQPVALEEIFIPAALVPDFGEVDIGVFSIYDVYAWNGVRPVRGEQSLTIARLEPAAARLIGLEGEVDVLKFAGTAFDAAGRAVEYSRSYTRADKGDYMVHFHK